MVQTKAALQMSAAHKHTPYKPAAALGSHEVGKSIKGESKHNLEKPSSLYLLFLPFAL